INVVAGKRAITIHAGKQYLASPTFLALSRPFDGVEASGSSSTTGENFPSVFALDLAGIDRDDHALGAELGSALVNQVRCVDRRGVHTNFVCTGSEQPAHIIDRADAAP